MLDASPLRRLRRRMLRRLLPDFAEETAVYRRRRRRVGSALTPPTERRFCNGTPEQRFLLLALRLVLCESTEFHTSFGTFDCGGAKDVGKVVGGDRLSLAGIDGEGRAKLQLAALGPQSATRFEALPRADVISDRLRTSLGN